MRRGGPGDLTSLFKQEFELCNLAAGEVVGLLTDQTTWREYAEAARGAAGALGAQVFEVSVGNLGWDVPTPVKGMGACVPAIAHPGPLLEAVEAALVKTSFVVDLLREGIIHADLRGTLTGAGARVITVIEPPDILERLMSSPDIKASVQAVGERIAGARRLTVTSAAGTEVFYDLEDTPSFTQYGYSDVPGKWDQWPSALAVCYPVDGSAQGTVVIAPGDIVFPMKRYVESPVRLTIKGGYVIAVDGATDAALVRGYLDSWEDPEVYACSHIGFGLHPRAQWSALAFYEKDDVLGMDGRSFLGNFLFSTGPNRYVERHVEAHLDIPMRNCTVQLDDDVLIEDGRMTAIAGGRGAA
jgi:2,5-dihydroxypyridine 5,6-dioxygenase